MRDRVNQMMVKAAQIDSAACHVFELKDDGDPDDVYDWARLAAHIALPIAPYLLACLGAWRGFDETSHYRCEN